VKEGKIKTIKVGKPQISMRENEYMESLAIGYEYAEKEPMSCFLINIHRED